MEQILYANLAPPFRTLDQLGEAGERFMRIVARINADPSSSIHAVFVRQFDEIRRRYLAALARSLPGLDPDELERRFHYTVAAMVHTFCWGKHIGPLSVRGHLDVGRLEIPVHDALAMGLLERRRDL